MTRRAYAAIRLKNTAAIQNTHDQRHVLHGCQEYFAAVIASLTNRMKVTPMSDKFTPTPEMMDELVEAAYKAYAHDRRPGIRGQMVTPNDDPMYRAVSAALALAIPMIAEECAKVASAHKGEAAKSRAKKPKPLGGWSDEVYAEEYGEDIASAMIADAIRAKFSTP